MNTKAFRSQTGSILQTCLGILAIVVLLDYSARADLTVAYSGSSDQAVIVSFFDRQTEGNNLVGTLQIQNISGTWVYIEQDLTSSPNPVSMPYTIYLLGPDDIKTFPNFTFPQGSYLKLTVTTPLGLDYTQPSEKLTALEGALAVDLSTRGLLTFSLPSDAFDEPPVGEVVEPLLDTFVSTVSPIGELGVAIQDKSVAETFGALADMAADSQDMLNALKALLKNYVTSDQIQSSLGFFAEFINLPEKVALVTDLSAQTFDAPPTTWSRMDIVSRTQAPNISSVSPTTLMTMPVPQTQPLTIHGSGFTASSSLVFTIGTATYPSRPERLQFIDANTLQYNIAVGSAVGTWSVRLADGTGSSTFQVNAASSGLYTITPVNGPHGSISPNGTLTKAAGESQTFIATPQDSTYTVDSWYVDGNAVPTTGNRFTLDDIQAAHTVYVTFRPVTTTAQAGSLVVSLSPANIGGQWQVGGGIYRNSGDIVTDLTPGQYTVSFKPVSGYTTPANQTVTVTANTQYMASASYILIAPSTYTLTLSYNATQGGASASPLATGNIYTAGQVVSLFANPSSGYHFTGWSGGVSGSANPIQITMNGNETVTANFASGDPNLATVTVTIKPDAAANAGVTWSVTGTSQLRASGTSLSEAVGTGYTTYLPVTLNLVAGWLSANGATSFNVPITAGIVTNVTLTCMPDTTPGLLTTTLSPPDAINAGAHWHVNGSTYGNGDSVSLSPGNYTITFDTIVGWTAPPSQQVTMQPSQTIVIPGNYTPPAGQPAIISISPTTGPNTGGTLMTINGANLAMTTNVLVGGKVASNISVSSATQVTCLTPASTTNGSVSVVVEATGGNATNSNGFAYGIARGNKLDFVSAMGGSCFAVAVNGNYAYVGEGRNLLVLDISQSTPSRVGRVTLPGLIKGIALLPPGYQYAYIADGEGGLQVVDIGNPTIPKIAGSYSTTNATSTAGIYIYGGRAYVADEYIGAGLEIFDLATPTAPALLSSTPAGGSVHGVVVKASANGTFAYETTGSTLQVVNVSQPTAPVMRGATGIGSATYSVSLSGNYVFGVDSGSLGTIHMVDISNPDAPTDLNLAAGGYSQGSYHAVAVQNNYLYAESVFQSIGLVVFNISGTNLVKIGQLVGSYTDSSYYDKMIASGNALYIASGASGFQIVDVSNPYTPSALPSFNDGGLFGNYVSVAVTGNTLCATEFSGAFGGSFNILDVSQPDAPVLRKTLVGVTGYQVLAGNGAAYLKAGDGIRIYDVTTPASPQLKATIAYTVVNSIANTANMDLVGNMLYVAGSSGSAARFAAIDVSNPSSPAIRGTKDYAFNGWGTCVSVSGGRAVMGIESPNELSLLDVSAPTTPAEIGSISLSDLPYTVVMSPDQNYAYSVDWNTVPSALRILDLRDPANLSVVTNISLDSASGEYVDIRGSELCAATYNGIYVFDANAEASPTLTRWYSISDIYATCLPTDSADQTGNIYVADGDGGIVVLKEQDSQPPEVFISDPIFGTAWTNTSSTMELGGGSDDNFGVTAVTWSNSRGGSGQVSPPLDNWYVSNIALYPGTNILTVTAYDAAGNSGMDTLVVVYQTSKQDQSITFPAIADHTFGDAPITLDAAASSGLPVNFSVISGPSTLTSSNVLTLTGAGSVTVQASQPGNDLYNAALSTNVTFNVSRGDQVITFAPLPDKSAGDSPFALSATASSGLPVYFDVVSGPATSSNNMITLLGGGPITVGASQPGNTNYNAAATVQQSFNVSKIPQTITFGGLSQQRVGDAPFPLTATASSGLLVSFSLVSGPAVLSGNVVTLTGSGTVSVTASQPGDATYAAAANVTQSFFVVPPDNTIANPELLADGSFQLAFFGTVGSNYTFQSSRDLSNWLPLFNFTCTNSPTILVDTNAMSVGQNFYRMKQ